MTVGGVAIIGSILAILFVIVAEAAPLFFPPRAESAGAIPLPPGVTSLGIDVDQHREIAVLVSEAGVRFLPVADGRALEQPSLPGLGDARIAGASALGRGPFAVGLSDGRVIPLDVTFTISYPEGRRRVAAALSAGEPVQVAAPGQDVTTLAYVANDTGSIIAAVTGPRGVTLVRRQQSRALIGPARAETTRLTTTLAVDGEVTSLALDERGEHLFVGTSTGQLAGLALTEEGGLRLLGTAPAGTRGSAIGVLGFLIGDRTLIAGDNGGGVGAWRLVRMDDGGLALERIYAFEPHAGPVVALSPSRRDKGFITGDAGGQVFLRYGTTGRTFLRMDVDPGGLRALSFAPKVDGFLAVGAGGEIVHWNVRNPHPEVAGLRALFCKIWYEGYDRPVDVGQSTGGTDDFESKLSLTPLIFGTLKGTFYALLFAVPLALLGALYASQFMHPNLRNAVKPVVEIMAALPSVVLGFLAGLWLAPRLEKVVPGVFLLSIVVPGTILLALAVWRTLPLSIRRRVRPGAEVLLLVPVVLVAGWVALRLGAVVEAVLLGGDYRSWLLSALGLTYDQRNSLVVGFTMGFAVVPIIFTIAEDSLSNVPAHLTAGSLALGATRWQTAVRVVLPTASPGIFSAVMIGFGRAVGETMIVLMVTGNTPVMDLSIFNGFRALSANVAVELPEAPQGGTLYRVLFVAALLLFVMTFIVNTAAEIVRLRLRRRYQGL